MWEDLKAVKQQVMRASGRKTFQVEGRASAKVPRYERSLVGQQIAKGPAWLVQTVRRQRVAAGRPAKRCYLNDPDES